MEEGQRPIYLDMQATTPVDPRVLDAMLPFFVGVYGNPHSRTHAYGWETDKAVEDARSHIASLVGADPKEIIFTSGATESNNMSVKGVARFFGRSGKKKHIITTQTEHKCVLDSCRHLQDEGFEVTYLPVQNSGLIDMKELEAAIRPETALVSIMAVNNEIGVIQPIEEIGKLCRAKKVFFHTDAAQAVGKIPIDVNAMNIDLMSISAHKIYGPKGIGACYVRRRPRVRLDPIISGGGQERGLRSGTLAPPLVVGFGEACRIAKREMEVRFGLAPFSFNAPVLPPLVMMICFFRHAWLSECRDKHNVLRYSTYTDLRDYCLALCMILGLHPFRHGVSNSRSMDLVRLEADQVPFGQITQRSALDGAHQPERRPEPLLSRLRQCVVCLRRGRVAADGAQRHCSIVGQRLHIGFARAQLRVARAWKQRRKRTLEHPVRYWAIHY